MSWKQQVHFKNPKEVLSRTEYQRYKKALNTFDKPVMIVTQDEVIEKEKVKSDKKTWRFVADNVRLWFRHLTSFHLGHDVGKCRW